MSRSSTEFIGTPTELFHWVPGEIVIVVRLPRIPLDDALDVLIGQVRAQLNDFLSDYQIALEVYGTAGRWSENPTMPPVRRRAFIFGLQRKQPLIALFFHTRRLDAQADDPVAQTLSYLHANLEQFAQVGLSIVSAMPNWLMVTAPLMFSEGGPFAPPRSAPTLDVPATANSLVGWHMKFQDQKITRDLRDAEDVVVAVLDTAQHPDRIRSAATRPELRRNWLLQRLANDLRQEDGSFVVEYDRYPLTNEVRTGHGATGDPRYYLMPDHGLSVAGIIRDLAPRVHIRQIRVLNDFGGGDIYTLFAALTDLERELVSGTVRRMVINLSLTIMPDIRRLPSIWFDQRRWPTTQLASVTRFLQHIEEGLRLLFESLFAEGALIVAAAGNDSLLTQQQNLSPRPPRSPARYESALSVTALNSTFAPSGFANAANLPNQTSGVATFGGDTVGVLDANGLPDAVRGIYISSTFSDGEQNVSGWADWSGTSFAVPTVSALGAHLLAQGWSAENIMTRLATSQERRSEALFGTAPDVPELLANRIRVQQRFGV
ncbi:MAG: S8 family serine peptidase [Ktedonobacteraceae bacterium]|nr:S8 family serine peptidase [Ktedonobacteraceae bacterium]